MRKLKYTLLLCILMVSFSYSQEEKVGIGTTNPQRTLHVEGNMRVTKLEDKTEDKKYDNVLLLKTKTQTKTVIDPVSGTPKTVISAGKGDIYHIPRRLFHNYHSIDLSAVSRVVVYNDVAEDPISDYSQQQMIDKSFIHFTNSDFRIKKENNFINILTTKALGSYQFQYRPTLYNSFTPQLLDYAIENRAAVFHTGGSNLNDPDSNERTGRAFLLSQDVSSVKPWRNLLPIVGPSRAVDSPVSEYIVFNFGVPFSVDNPFQSIYKIRVNTLGYSARGLYNTEPMSKIGFNTPEKAYIFYTIQELANSRDLPRVEVPNSERFALWITGAFVGRNGRAVDGGPLFPTKNKQYPAGLEIYIPDPNALTWENARHFEIRFGDGNPRPLFTSSTQFNGFITALKGNVSNVGNFIYLYYADKNDQFGVSFPNSVYGNMLTSKSLIYNMKPGKDEYEYIAGKVSVILYYKGFIVDSIGDGVFPLDNSGYKLGETLTGKTPRFPNPLGPRSCIFEWGGWLKRKPGTSPIENDGFFNPDDWYHPKDQENENYRPWNYNVGNNTESAFPFPVGNRPSSGKPGTHWAGDTYPGYTYP